MSTKVEDGSALNRISNKDLRRMICEILELPGFRLEGGKKHLVLVAPDGATRGVPTTTHNPRKHVFRQFVRTHSDANPNGGLLDVRRKKESAMPMSVPAPAEFNVPQFDAMERLLRRALPRDRCNAFIEEVVRCFRRAAPIIGRRLADDPALELAESEFAGFSLDTLEQAAAKATMAMRAIERPGFPRGHHNRFTPVGRKVPEHLWEPWRDILTFCHRWYREFGTTRGKGGERHYSHSLKEPIDALLAIEAALNQTPEKAIQQQAIALSRTVGPTLTSYSAIEYLSTPARGVGGGVRVNKLDFDHQPYGVQFGMVVSDHEMLKPVSGAEVQRLQRVARAEANGHKEEPGELVKLGPPTPEPVVATPAAESPMGEVEIRTREGQVVGLSEVLISAASRVETLESENRELWARVEGFEGEMAEAVAAAEARGREQAREQMLERILNG